MRGDFSSFWSKEDKRNFQSGLEIGLKKGLSLPLGVLLDRDWNAQTEILNDWQEIAAQDIIGAGVAGVPWEAKNSFKINRAFLSSAEILLTVNEGRVWAGGTLVEVKAIDAGANVERVATYLEPPIQTPKALFPVIPSAPPTRDAVILEAWREELNAFQVPELLLEPALGGVDTTERMHTAFRFRLYRMSEGDTCDSIIPKLKDDFGKKGKLTVTLQADQSADTDCPVAADGGYTGFEHQLYRIEIAKTDPPNENLFKWSQFNGGLVGKGDFDTTNGVELWSVDSGSSTAARVSIAH